MSVGFDCDHKSFLESVYTTNKDEPGIIVVKPDFCCKFYKPKTNLQYQIEKQNKINELFENGKDIDPELTKNFITFPIK